MFGEAKACWELHRFLWQVPRDKDHEFEVAEEPVSTQALVLSWGVRAPHNVDTGVKLCAALGKWIPQGMILP